MNTLIEKQKKDKLTKSDLKELKTLADALIKTLGSMSAEHADRVVKEVANTIYTDILGKKGRIIKSEDMFVCTGNVYDDSSYRFWKYKWEDDK